MGERKAGGSGPAAAGLMPGKAAAAALETTQFCEPRKEEGDRLTCWSH